MNQNVAYETKSMFGENKNAGDGRPFHHTTERFKYYPKPKDKAVDPTSYNLGHTFGNDSR